MGYRLSLKGLAPKKIYSLGDDFRGRSDDGEELSFTNYYMMKNGKPFFGVSGEFHFSRMSASRWEDELIKMKLGGLNTVSTYIFWIHHEEEEGKFDFSGRRDLRRFVSLCKKHSLYVILRVGPFDHGEVRNGGLPDWLYGKPFEVRTTNQAFLDYVKRLYTKIGQEVSGLFFRDNGPVIGVQLDNEYMHSSAPWEITTGISNEWIFGGNEGNTYMLKLKELASECGLLPVFYTCTGWGGAATPDNMMPLWGGYAFRPWLFYSYKGEHPATEEYVYQDFHNNEVECTNDFKPSYRPEERPYACCEMGGGMMCSYYYRFQLPYKSVDAMANIKLAGGCNFLGYYMFHGGSNPTGKHGTFMNESQVSKISYDYQAALGEFGQERESYRRLKSLHYFVTCFADRLCSLQTVLPEGASRIQPRDMDTLRYAVRTDGVRGFLFVNNYQDHAGMPDRENEEVTLQLEVEEITYKFGIAGDENAILPFHFDLDGIDLVQATAQPLLRIAPEGDVTYVFMVPDGMRAQFIFEDGTRIDGEETFVYTLQEAVKAASFAVSKGEKQIRVLVLSREMANQMFRIDGDRLVFTRGSLLEDKKEIKLETRSADNCVMLYPKGSLDGIQGVKDVSHEYDELFDCYQVTCDVKEIGVTYTQVNNNRYVLSLSENFMEGCKDALLRIHYTGDIGNAFINGKLVHDNFCNGAVWEIGLRDYTEELKKQDMTIYIVPLKKGVNVNVESAMAARIEEAKETIGALQSVEVQPVYEITIRRPVRRVIPSLAEK